MCIFLTDLTPEILGILCIVPSFSLFPPRACPLMFPHLCPRCSSSRVGRAGAAGRVGENGVQGAQPPPAGAVLLQWLPGGQVVSAQRQPWT